MKEFVCFSTTDVFVPVSQLSTRDLFYFLENLKIKQDIFVLSLSSCQTTRSTSVMITLFQIIFWNKMFKKVWILEFFWGILQSQLQCRSWIFDTSLFRKMFKLLTCKRNHNFEFRSSCRECLLFKRLRDMVLVSGQNEILLLLLSLFFMLRNNVCFKSSNCR